jgi:YfiH family protein
MISQERNGVKYFQFASLAMPGITQAIFSRHGGLSEYPWSSLNLGGTVGDDPANVKGNLEILLKTVGYESKQLVQVKQIHSADVILANNPMDTLHQGDAIITNTPGLLLLMRFADCVPILFVDPVNNAVGIAHAGWQGTVKEVAFHTVRAMETQFRTNPSDLVVGIGPSIGPDHYVVGEDVIERAQAAFPEHTDAILIKSRNSVKLDLWKANAISLQRAGVTNIEISGICTGCTIEDWYSHRGENGKTGRFAGVIGLK